MPRTPKPSGSLKRRVASRPERKTVVLFTEGTKSEPNYFEAVQRLPAVQQKTAITIDARHGVPITLVEAAAARASDPEIDEVWCVFDIECPQPHPRIRESPALARGAGVLLAVSNPCFELWLLLHECDRSAPVTTRDAESDSRHIEGRPGKAIDGGSYMPRIPQAVARARALDVKHDADGTNYPNDNPSSTVYHLLESVGAT